MGTNEMEYEENAPGLEDQIKVLAGIDINEPDTKPVNGISLHLLSYLFGIQWQHLTGQQRQLMIDASTERLLYNYRTLQTLAGEKTEKAARQSIESELSFLINNIRYSR